MESSRTSSDVNAIAETRNLVTAIKLKELFNKRKGVEEELLPILDRVASAQAEKEKVQILVDAGVDKSGGTGSSSSIYKQNSSASEVLAMSESDPTITEHIFKTLRIEGQTNLNHRLRKAQYASLFGSIFNEWMNFEGKVDQPDIADGVQTPKSDDESVANLTSNMIGRPEKFTQKAELENIIFKPDPKAKPDEFVAFLEGLFKKAAEEANNEGKTKSKLKPSVVTSEKDDVEDEEYDDDDEEMEDADDDDTEGDVEEEEEEEEDEDEDEDERYLNGWQGEVFTLEKLKNTIGRFGGSMRKNDCLELVDVKQAIHGLVSGELLTEAKKAACKEILLSDVILNEIAAVLTLRLREIENWNYSEPSVQLNFRRHLNGKYRCYADEPLLDAIFLQWIGVRWGMEFRRVLEILYNNSSLWLRPADPIDAARQEVRSTMLSGETSKSTAKSVATQERAFMKEFFLTLLPESLYDFRTYNEDGEEADEEKKDNEKIRRARNEELKQMLLQRLLIDRQYSDAVDPGKYFTVVQADAYRFAQSQSHEIILALMELVGVSTQWLKFFETFLKLPARFETDGETRQSRRGVPISHPLGLVFGEVQFFFMELAINRATRGDLQVFRMHDDVWWWSADEKKCELAWDTIKQYSILTGTDWNLDKSGCVRISNETLDPNDWASSTLPKGDISWGFIQLGTDGRWKIKPEEIAKHTQELRRQMEAQKSIMGMISAYNRYMKFFVRNFGKPARAFGKQHVQQIIAAVNEIHISLFPSHKGDFLAFIASLIATRFGDELVEPIAPAWLLIPVAYGGLGVRNVFFDIYPVLKAYNIEEVNHKRSKELGYGSNPQTFGQCVKKDRNRYEQLKSQWFKTPKPIGISWEHDIHDGWFDGSVDEWLKFQAAAKSSRRGKKPHPFITYEEFVLGRHSRFDYWGVLWKELAETPDAPGRHDAPERIKRGLETYLYFGENNTEWLKKNWSDNTPYWKTFLLSFGEQLLETFGTFRILNGGMLPEAMIDIYTNMKTSWDQ